MKTKQLFHLFLAAFFLLALTVNVSQAQEKPAAKKEMEKHVCTDECKEACAAKMEKKECGEDCTKPCCANKEAKHVCTDACKDGNCPMMKKEAKHECTDACKDGKCPMMKKEKTVGDASTAKAWNAVCPVLGNEVDSKTVTVKHGNKVIGFCCPGCDKKFQADPEKYLKNLSEDGQTFVGKKS